MWETAVKLFLARRMKCALVSALISLALVSQALAVLRPLFPAKPAPPFNREVIIIEDDSLMGVCKKTSGISPGSGTVAGGQTKRYDSVTGCRSFLQRFR